MSRDTGRRSVYVAEDAAFAGTPLVEAPGVEVLASALSLLFESPWWAAHDLPVPAVAFRAGRNDGFVRRGRRPAAGDDTAGRQAKLVSLGTEATWHVASHEIAHLITRSDDRIHGAAFRGGHLAVVSAVFGRDCAHELRNSYERFGLEIAPAQSPAATPDLPVWDELIAWELPVGGWRAATRMQNGHRDML